MLYNYKLTLSQMGQIKNYKKNKNFTHSLVDIEDVELSIYEIDCIIEYKKTVPLNLFEKYSIRLIEKADEISSCMDIEKIAQLLHLDTKLIEDNLENLEEIGMLNGVKSDFITINKDDNSEYIQHENKFKIETIKEHYYMTKNEYDDMKSYIKYSFKNNSQYKDKKYVDFSIRDERTSTKSVKILYYTEDKFLTLSQNGINDNNDLKFIDDTILTNTYREIKEDIFCHYDEFLPILRDKLTMNRDKIVVISSKSIEDKNLDILKAVKNLENIYILTQDKDDKHNNDRIFNIELEDCVLCGDNYYSKDKDFIIKQNSNSYKLDIVDSLRNYFVGKIREVIPEYNLEDIDNLNTKIEELQKQLNKLELSTIKEINKKIQKMNEEKNNLYGISNKNSKIRSAKRKEIDKLDIQGKEDELKKYPIYLANKKAISELKKKIENLEKDKNKVYKINQQINNLNKQKSDLIPEDKKNEITSYERELKNIQRILDE